MLCSHVVLRQSLRRCHARLASTIAAAPVAETRRPRGRPRKTPLETAIQKELPKARGRGRPRRTVLENGNATVESERSRKAPLKHGEDEGGEATAASSSEGKAKRMKSKVSPKSPKTPVAKRTPSPKRRQSLLVRPQKHHDLASFLEYAARNKLKKGTSVYRGNHYEYTAAETLKRYNFTLQKTGRSNDLGIDLVGTWHLPTEPHELRVLIQCKCSKPKPSFVRELEGAYVGAPAGWKGDDVMALLVTRDPATQGVRNALQRSRLPMGFAQISELGHMQQLMWNHAAQESRLTGMTVTNLYKKSAGGLVSSSADSGRLPGSISLLWMGKQWASSPPIENIDRLSQESQCGSPHAE